MTARSSAPDASEVAARLTEAQRAQMLDLPCSGMGAGLFSALLAKGLIDIHDTAPDDEFVQATVLGEAVRSILEKGDVS
jgi:hypothetical protein